MSLEIDPVMLEFRGTAYDVFASINEEHHDQIDFVRIVRRCDGLEIDQRKKYEDPAAQLYLQALTEKAIAVGRKQLSDVEFCNGEWESVIDYADTAY